MKPSMRLLLSSALGASLMLGAGCGSQTYQLIPGERSPAAKGTVKVDRSPNDNSKIEVEVKHLPPPQNLDPSLSTFVVWVEPTNGRPATNLGQLQIDSDRNGKIEAVTPFEQFRVWVTAEANPTPQRPSSYVILRTDVHEKS